ncbi:MAG: signal peptidase I [Candidatus Levybacteria bacterium RIFCSPHIGHO2_01_FULL_42_15]|nr:MAG: signal peptidase I [Candidatus Levybacteria bacterium RIFCSPHIGHO2_01_FULL_42_15]OGH41994.1 MAG: signal peptidase I [Candidatus Levybacteria bacterium RIFCSPLOWO2_01_FULL_42_15]
MFLLKKIYGFLIDTAQTVLLAATVFLITYIFLLRPFQVSGQSMYPTFYDKEYVLTDLITIKFYPPQRGDVVVFKSPTDPDKDFIKRIIGVPSDTVALKDGNVYVNEKELDEGSYVSQELKTYGGSFLGDNETIKVSEGEYFVSGDNRSHSSDSREFGTIKQKDIIGKSFFVYWPPNKIRGIKNPFDN